MNLYSGLESLHSPEQGEEASKLLRESLQKSDGVLRIAVHPFYMDWDLEHRSSDIQRENLTIHQYNRDSHMRLFESDSEAKPPVLILEGFDEIPETKNKLTSVGPNVFMFPTFSGEPYPYYEDVSIEDI